MARYFVIKANGQKEPFFESKIQNSINKAGVPQEMQLRLIKQVKRKLKSGTTTKDINRWLLRDLKSTPYPEGRFNLKRALMELGPTGYPFEKFVSVLLQNQGYSVQTDLILSGRCVNHEVDIIAEKAQKRIFIECKFHNAPGIKSDIKVALYSYARYDDLVCAAKADRSRPNGAWLITNTKCTMEAIHYANCMGMQIVSWGYPNQGNLQQLIETDKLYPITCIQSLGSAQKAKLLLNDIVTVKDLLRNTKFIDLLQLTDIKVSIIQKEAEQIYKF